MEKKRKKRRRRSASGFQWGKSNDLDITQWVTFHLGTRPAAEPRWWGSISRTPQRLSSLCKVFGRKFSVRDTWQRSVKSRLADLAQGSVTILAVQGHLRGQSMYWQEPGWCPLLPEASRSWRHHLSESHWSSQCVKCMDSLMKKAPGSILLGVHLTRSRSGKHFSQLPLYLGSCGSWGSAVVPPSPFPLFPPHLPPFATHDPVPASSISLPFSGLGGSTSSS